MTIITIVERIVPGFLDQTSFAVTPQTLEILGGLETERGLWKQFASYRHGGWEKDATATNSKKDIYRLLPDWSKTQIFIIGSHPFN